jgi:hypothetical protein
MSSGAPDALQAASSEVNDRRIQGKWTTLLRRADARESALRNALTHARAQQAHLREQLDGERRRHAIESGRLRERLQRIERSFMSYIAAARGRLIAPLGAAPRDVTALLGPSGGPPVDGRSAPPAPAVGTPRLAPAVAGACVPAPFDPVATVASLLPLSQAHAGAPEADVDGALHRLQAVVRTTNPEAAAKFELAADATQPAPAQIAPSQELGHDRAERQERYAPEEVSSVESPWFPRAFRRLTEEDPAGAGRLFLQLLGAQGLVWPEDVAYRVEVAETGALAVDVRGGHSTVRALLESDAEAQAGEPVLRTDLAGLARAVTGRRGWGRVGARVAGVRNRHLRPLRALAAAPLELGDLKRAGVQPDPALLLRALALAIDPEWTAAEIFTVACRWRGRERGGCYIHVFERAPVAVTSAPPLGRVTATLTCAPHDLLAVLVGELPLDGTRALLSGDRAAAESLLEWIGRADATATRLPRELAGAAV